MKVLASIWAGLQTLFSGPSLAALRNVLTAGAVFIGALGIAGLTSTDLQRLVDAIMTVGTAGAVLITAISALVAALMPIIAALKATLSSRQQSVAAQPNTIVVQTNSAAATLKAANAVAEIPEVQKVVAAANVAAAAPSDKVVAK